MTPTTNIRPKERDAIIQSLRAGVVPHIGLQYVQVGRISEIKSIISDLDRLKDGGSSIRFIIGDYGSGKTFFLHLTRSIALEKGLLTLHADLTPDRRIHATGGQARALYAELMRNLSSRTKPDGGALASIVEKFIGTALSEAKEKNKKVDAVIQEKLLQLNEMVGGYDFSDVISSYWKGHDTGNEQLKSDAIRWLRGEFTTKTDARNALGVRTIIDDSNVYDRLKLFSVFARLSGYAGILICLDELVNLYKMANAQARNANYEQILRILNDCLQGTAVGLGFILCGTPDFLMDPRRGLFSYTALQSRLTENTFAKTAGVNDFSGPVLRLANLTVEDLYVLLSKLRHIYAYGDSSKYLLPDEALKAFMIHCSERIGEAYFRTPRTTIKSFIDLLSILSQNNNILWTNLLGQIQVNKDTGEDSLDTQVESPAIIPEASTEENNKHTDDELTTFKL